MRISSLNNRAFTLLELIVVMALIALTISLAVPKFADFLYTDQLKVAARRLAGLVNQSSQLAQRHQVPYLLRYIANERRFVVEPEQRVEGGETINKDRGLLLVEAVTVRGLWSWYGGTRSAEEFVIRFDKNGYVEPTIIYLSDAGGAEMSVVLSPFMGKVQIVGNAVAADKNAFFQ
jgi:general secretion pathway protein H